MGHPCRAPVDGLSRRAEGDYGIVFGLFESIRLGTELPKGGVMLDHVTANVGDFDQAKRFYEQALAPLGYSVQMEFEGVAGFGTGEGIADFWIGSNPERGAAHVA